jgi:signal transduction histidine kinase
MPEVAVGAAAGLAGAGTAHALLQARGERHRCKGLSADAARLETVLAASPLAWSAWNGPTRLIGSPDFATLLGREALRPDDVATVLAPADGVRFLAALTALRRDGTGLRLEVATADGRHLLVCGQRAFSATGEPLDIVWLDDISARTATTDGLLRESAAAQAAADELRTALDTLPVPVWLRHDDLTLAWCNQAYARAVDAAPDRAVAEQRELAPAGAGRELAARTREAGVAQSRVVPLVVGAERRLLELTEAALAAPGSGLVTVGYALDLTVLEAARTNLAQHVKAHAEVLERLGTAIAIFAADGRLSFFNQAYVRLWELDEIWLRGEPTHGELMEELRARRKLPEYADFQSFKRERLTRYTQLMEPMEELMHLPDGTTLRLLAAPHPLGGLITIMEDVTNTLALESSYNTLIAVQQETLDNLAEGIAVFGGDGRLKLSNPAFARIWDLSDTHLTGEPHITGVFDRMRPFFVDDSGRDDEWEELKDEMVGSTLERTGRSGRLERTDGSVVEFSTVPLPDGAVLNSYLDVTDSARLEQALRASNAALEAADQLKSEFIASVSHHLRTPLNGIIGFAEVLANQYFGELNPRQTEYVKGVLGAGERLLTLIDDIVDLTSIGAGMTTLERGPVDVADLVDQVASLTREWARREGLRLEVSASPDLGVLDGDGKRLKQALFTLVVNAIRSPPADGRIALEAGRTDDEVVFVVGAASGDAPPRTVSGRFERADTRGGLAPGLSLVRNVIELHGGRLELDSDGARGVRVRCFLPRTPKILPGMPRPAPRKIPPASP